MSDERLHEVFDNTIFVIDEVHNLTDVHKGKGKDEVHKGKDESQMYDDYKRLLNTVKGCKILLLSGTPMRNSADQIAPLMNLILPVANKLPTGKDFMKQFFTGNKLKELGVRTLRKAFKGRVSYIQASKSTVYRDFKGITITQGQSGQHSFKLWESKMSDFQTKSYKKAWDLDTGAGESGKLSGVSQNSRQASLFVFPDGSYGEEGFKKYIEKQKTVQKLGPKGGKTRYTWSKPNGSDLETELINGGIDALHRYSSKYEASIRIITDALRDKKLVFIYNEFIHGGGIILFGLILEAFGFKTGLKW